MTARGHRGGKKKRRRGRGGKPPATDGFAVYVNPETGEAYRHEGGHAPQPQLAKGGEVLICSACNGELLPHGPTCPVARG